MNGNAVISKDGKYRYCLVRRWIEQVEHDDTLLWVMLNPSTADAEVDDNTIRKIIKFSQAWGYGGLMVVNLFAYRATEPKDLLLAEDPIGPENLIWIENAMSASNQTIAAWGQGYPKSLRPHVRMIAARLQDRGARHLGLTKSGEPKHPLYLPDSSAPRYWN